MKKLIKFILLIILAIISALSILILLSIAYEKYYMTIYHSKEIICIVNNSFVYMSLAVISIFIFILRLYFPKLFFKEESIEGGNFIGNFFNKVDSFISQNKKAFLIIFPLIILMGFLLSVQKYSVFYEDEIKVFNIFKQDKTYEFKDVDSYTIEIAGLFNNGGNSMKLHMNDGVDVEVFGQIAITSDEFDNKYNTYGYNVYVDKSLLNLGKEKVIKDKEQILEDSDYYDEPHRSHIRSLVGEE
ncbi:hypothetical protein GC105_10265 [Alkalibaculum sp. M08DMB]|uniref:Uncharacterized protein n=1 Tax=Alkalibaculum sporogenes TaxID=2655001 RepID=A0A6A7KAW1_9FIRM|nr:hypothetical protein [Alkalibaculum sporogenes]MPW26173.1 hypothetical protein [Alkalibaculum sporogenes]